MVLDARLAALLRATRAGDRRALGRAISAVERGAVLPDDLQPCGAEPMVVALTGPPGAGKSTLVSALATHLVARGNRLAVLLVDPSSPTTGGAVLGDRARMTGAARGRVFVRSLADRGHGRGVTATLAGVLAVVREAPFDVVLLETVGTGQSDVAVVGLADRTAVVVPPHLGDELQAMKAGILELADVLVITKADLPGASRVEADLAWANHARRVGAARPVVRTSATEGTGIAELADALLVERPSPERRRVRRLGWARDRLADEFADRARTWLLTSDDPAITDLAREFAVGRLAADVAAARAVAPFVRAMAGTMASAFAGGAP